MPRLRSDHQRLAGADIETFRKLLLDAFGLAAFDIMLAGKLGIRRENIALGDNFETIVYRVIEDAEMKSWSAELLQAARSARQTHIGLLEFAQRFDLEPPTAGLEQTIRAALPALDPEPWLMTAAARLGQVCRVEIPAAPSYGTGFLVGPDLVLTCYHVVQKVVASKLSPSFIRLRFDERVKSGNPKASKVTALHASEWLVDSAPISTAFDDVPAGALDYALLRTAERVGDEVVDTSTGKQRGWMPVSPFPYTFAADSPLVILGHPGGDSLKLTLDTSSVVGVNGAGGANGASGAAPTRVRYRTNTKGGSSGSPCFDYEWNLVALHHYGDIADPPQFNQGIPISAIRSLWEQRLAGADLAAWQRAALQAIVDQEFNAD